MKIFHLFLFITVAFVSLNAKTQDHLKKCEAKGLHHTIRNIDFIYMINLDERPEKFEKSRKMLEPFNIIPYRFSAVNGWKLPLEVVNDVGVKYTIGMKKNLMGTFYPLENKGNPSHEIMHIKNRNYFCHCMSRGAVAIYLSHISIINDAYDSNYNAILVMEDDIEIIKYPHLISDRIDELNAIVGKNGWDILFLDRDTKNKYGHYVECKGFAFMPNFNPGNNKKCLYRKNVSKNIRGIGARYGCYSMLVNRSGMKKIINFSNEHQIFLPIDMTIPLIPGIKLFTVREDIISTRIDAFSDNGGPNYKK